MEIDGISNLEVPNQWYGIIIAQHQWVEEPYIPEGDNQQKIFRKHATTIIFKNLEYNQQYQPQSNELIIATGLRYNDFVYIIDYRNFANNKLINVSNIQADSNLEKNDVVVFKNGKLSKATFLEMISTFIFNCSSYDIKFINRNKLVIAYSDVNNNNFGTVALCYCNDGIIISINKIVFKQSALSNIKIHILSNDIMTPLQN